MKRKNVIAAILAGVMTVGCMTGCGNTDNTKNSDSPASSEVKTESSAEASAETSSEAEEPAEPVKLTIWVNEAAGTPYYEAIGEACNVEFEFVDSAGGKDALSLLIGSNTLPDLVFAAETNISGGVQSLLASGALVPLNEFMDKGWMPNLRAYLDSEPEVDNLCKNDEGMYAWAPMIRGADSYLIFSGFAVRKDWLDDLNLEVPTTIDEMEEVLLAFKEEKGAETGLQFCYKSDYMLPLSWGVCEDMYLDNGTIKYGYLEDAYKDYLEVANRWIELGILDPDTFTQDTDTYWAKVASGKSGMGFIFTGSGFSKLETIKTEVPEMDYIPMAYPTLNKGEEYPVDTADLRTAKFGIFVSSTCENQEAAARVIDYIYSEEGTMLSNYGIEGVSYEMVDGTAVYTELLTNNPDGLTLTSALAKYAGAENKPYILTGDAQIQKYALQVQQDSLKVWDATGASIRKMVPGTLTEAETEEYNQIMGDINTYVSEYKLKFILGTESLDNFDTFRENLKKMNIERAIEIKQAAYDRFVNR